MAAVRKIVKPKGSAEPTEFEVSVANAIADLENNEYKAELRALHITAAKEIDAGSGKRAILIFVPVPQLKAWHKIGTKLVRELEKKFAGKHVIIVAQRRIIKKPSRTRSLKQPRPRSRTLTAVHDAILDDLVYPSEIVGKRTRVRTDNSKIIKVYVRAPHLAHSAGHFGWDKLVNPHGRCLSLAVPSVRAASWTARTRRRSSTSWRPSPACTNSLPARTSSSSSRRRRPPSRRLACSCTKKELCHLCN